MTAAAPSLELSSFDTWHDARWPEPPADAPYAWKVDWRFDKAKRRIVWDAALQAGTVAVPAGYISRENLHRATTEKYRTVPILSVFAPRRGDYVALYTAPPTDALPAAVPAGFVLVPVEPTDYMQSKGAYIVSGVTREGAAATYRAMITAAPKPTDEAPPKGNTP